MRPHLALTIAMLSLHQIAMAAAEPDFGSILTFPGKPRAINNAGQIVGSNGTAGFLMDKNGALTPINYPGTGATATVATSLNNLGWIIGNFTDTAGNPNCWLRDPAGNFTTFSIPLTIYTSCEGINDLGQIVGSFKTATQTGWYLAKPPDVLQTFTRPAVALNNGGLFVGSNVIFSTIAAVPVSIGYMPLYPPTLSAINNYGETVGQGTNRQAGYIYPFGFFRSFAGDFQTTYIGSLTGINDLREVVGDYWQFSAPAPDQNIGFVTRPCLNSVPTPPSAPIAGGTLIVPVSAPVNCGYQVTNNNEWITVTLNGRLHNFGSALTLNLAPNASGIPRTADIHIGDQLVAIRQDGLPCAPILNGGLRTFDSIGGVSLIQVAIPAGCPWTASSSVPWIAVQAVNGNAQYAVAQNWTNASRSGTLTIAGQTVLVSQTGATACSISLGLVGSTAPNAGGPISIPITASGAQCPWTVTQVSPFLTITSASTGQGSGAITASVAPNPAADSRSGSITIEGQKFIVAQSGTTTIAATRFVPIFPCRIADTRSLGFLPANSARSFAPAAAVTCGIPGTARAYSLNVTAVPLQPLSYITIWPTGQTQPYVSTLNSPDAGVVANAAIVPAGSGGAISVYASDATDIVLDVNGYFIDANKPEGYAFYATDPCRMIDTRGGQPFQGAGQPRNFALGSGPCAPPATARAYSLNFTAVPTGNLAYLTAWPQGQGTPTVSTLNSPNGKVVANAALIPAGINGGVTVYAFMPPLDSTHLVIDTNGYFAPSDATPSALSFYPVTPCRIADTRLQGQPMPSGGSTRTFPITCGIPSTAKAYSLNFTVVPTGPVGYLTTWATGRPQPFVSTLNSSDGRIIANAAIVPAGDAGAISVYTLVESGSTTHVVIDINGYFAP